MERGISIVLVVMGAILFFYGLNAADSLSSAFSEMFSGTPSSKAIWFMVGGTVALVLGLVGMRGKPSA